MATGQKISAQTPATSFDSTDLMTIVQSGSNKSLTHDVLMDDTQICKAWVNFNGTGTVAIRDDFNVSSITDNGTGDYTINFTNNLDDANYVILGFARRENDTVGYANVVSSLLSGTKTVSACQITTIFPNPSSPSAIDSPEVNILIFGS